MLKSPFIVLEGVIGFNLGTYHDIIIFGVAQTLMSLVHIIGIEDVVVSEIVEKQ